VRGIAGKTEELQTELLKRNIYIAIIAETKKKNEGSEDKQLYICTFLLLSIFPSDGGDVICFQ